MYFRRASYSDAWLGSPKVHRRFWKNDNTDELPNDLAIKRGRGVAGHRKRAIRPIACMAMLGRASHSSCNEF
jgi:hypothetical protein